jgi:hypothetical protein
MKVGRACKIAFQEMFIPFPFSNRECIMYGFGANRMFANGTILVIAKSYSEVTDPIVRAKVGEVNDQRRPRGLVENKVHYYGFEISPVSSDELSLRVVLMVDPQIPVIPDSLINYATKQLGEDMISKLLKLSKDFKGTKYEEKLKNSDNKEFYNWLKQYITSYCD